MKACFNDNREVLGIGANIAGESERDDWIELKKGQEIPSREDLYENGCPKYKVDEEGVLSLLSDEEKNASDIYKYSRLHAKIELLKEKQAWEMVKANESLEADEIVEVDKKIAKFTPKIVEK